VNDPMRIFGHPVHPMLVHFPIAFWTVATVAYGLVASGASELAVPLAKFSNGAGLLLAMLAMLAGGWSFVPSTAAVMRCG